MGAMTQGFVYQALPEGGHGTYRTHGIFQIKEDPWTEEPEGMTPMRSLDRRFGSTVDKYFADFGPLVPYDQMRFRSHP